MNLNLSIPDQRLSQYFFKFEIQITFAIHIILGANLYSNIFQLVVRII